jgi:small subunit ribosomal protein S17
MAEATKKTTGRATKVGEVVSTSMKDTIVVKVDMKKAHPLYKRVIKRSKKFYAHDAGNTALVGDVVRIEETRPMSKLKRWRLVDVVRRSALAQAGITEQQAS